MDENSMISNIALQANENSVTNHLENNRTPLDLRNLNKNNTLKNARVMKYEIKDGKLIKIWICGICNKKFEHEYLLLKHDSTHYNEREFRCTVCGKGFRQLSTLYQHQAIHSSERPYICEECPKTFNRISTLISHRKTHIGIKPHKCKVCNKAFHQKGNLRNHIFTHTNERPYKCDYCGKGFNQTSNLMCHKLKIHQEATPPNFVCHICGKKFFRRVALRNHELNEHSIPNSSISNPNGLIFLDAIKTKEMKRTLEANQVPFALFRPLTGIPVIVKVLQAVDKNRNILVPTSAEDLKTYGKFFVTDEKLDEGCEEIESKPVGCTVQIKIPIVATIIQQSSQEESQMTMSTYGKENVVATESFENALSEIQNVIKTVDSIILN